MNKSRKKNSINEKSNEEKMEFIYNDSKASEVCLAGDFNNWDIQSLPMKRNDGEVWKTQIKLSPGRYEYKYFVDGKWIEDVPGSEMVQNPLGTRNCVIHVK